MQILRLTNSNITLEQAYQIYKWRFLQYPDCFIKQQNVSLNKHFNYLFEQLASDNNFWFGCFPCGSKSKDIILLGSASLYNLDVSKSTIEFGRLLVDPSYRSIGIGSKLLEHSILFSRDFLNLHNIILQVKKDNKRAVALYKKYGFYPLDEDPYTTLKLSL